MAVPASATQPTNTHQDLNPVQRRLLGYLDVIVPFEIIRQATLDPHARIAAARAAWEPIIHCEGKGRDQLTGGADLQFGGPAHNRERAALVTVLATLAYQPGGVTWMGRHWCTNHQECVAADQYAADNPIPWDKPTPVDPPETLTFRGLPLVDLPALTGVL